MGTGVAAPNVSRFTDHWAMVRLYRPELRMADDAAGIHHAFWRCSGGCVAARGARATGGQAANDRVPGSFLARSGRALGGSVRAATGRTRMGRGAQRSYRIWMG